MEKLRITIFLYGVDLGEAALLFTSENVYQTVRCYISKDGTHSSVLQTEFT